MGAFCGTLKVGADMITPGAAEYVSTPPPQGDVGTQGRQAGVVRDGQHDEQPTETAAETVKNVKTRSLFMARISSA